MGQLIFTSTQGLLPGAVRLAGQRSRVLRKPRLASSSTTNGVLGLSFTTRAHSLQASGFAHRCAPRKSSTRHASFSFSFPLAALEPLAANGKGFHEAYE